MNSDTSAISRGLEAVWNKALGYVTREPYRGLIAAELARIRFMMALSREVSKRDAMNYLTLARATNPGTVSKLLYAFTYAAILVPALRVQWLQRIRRFTLRRFTPLSFDN
jgi:hypothetical protein